MEGVDLERQLRLLAYAARGANRQRGEKRNLVHRVANASVADGDVSNSLAQSPAPSQAIIAARKQRNMMPMISAPMTSHQGVECLEACVPLFCASADDCMTGDAAGDAVDALVIVQEVPIFCATVASVAASEALIWTEHAACAAAGTTIRVAVAAKIVSVFFM